MDTGGSKLWVKAVEAWSRPLTSIQGGGKNCGALPPLSYMASWYSSYLHNCPLNHNFFLQMSHHTYGKNHHVFEKLIWLCFQTWGDIMGFRMRLPPLSCTISVLCAFSFTDLKLRIVWFFIWLFPPLISVLLITVDDCLMPLLCIQEAPDQTVGPETSCHAVSCASPSIRPGKCSIRVLFQDMGASIHVINNNHTIRGYVTYVV
jgi:hypothetical protein